MVARHGNRPGSVAPEICEHIAGVGVPNANQLVIGTTEQPVLHLWDHTFAK